MFKKIKDFFLAIRIISELLWEITWFSKIHWKKFGMDTIKILPKILKIMKQVGFDLRFFSRLTAQEWLYILSLTQDIPLAEAFYDRSLKLRIFAWLTLPIRVAVCEYRANPKTKFFEVLLVIQFVVFWLLYKVIRLIYRLFPYLYRVLKYYYEKGRKLYFLQLEADYSYQDQETPTKKTRLSRRRNTFILTKVEIWYQTKYCLVSSSILNRMSKLRFQIQNLRNRRDRNRTKIPTKSQTISSRLVHVIFQLPAFLVKIYQFVWTQLVPTLFKAVIISIIALKIAIEPLSPILDSKPIQLPETPQTRIIPTFLKSELEYQKKAETKIETLNSMILEADDQPLETLDQVDAKLPPKAKEKQKQGKKYVPLHKRTKTLSDLKQEHFELDNRQFIDEISDSNNPVPPIVEKIKIPDKNE